MENLISHTIEPKRFNCIAYIYSRFFFSVTYLSIVVKLFHAFTVDMEQWDDSCSHLIAKPSVFAKEIEKTQKLKFDAFR